MISKMEISVVFINTILFLTILKKSKSLYFINNMFVV
jgi:hypothetical protein